MNHRWLVVLALAAAPPLASAHHSAIRFDLTIRDNEVTGIVKEFKPANPPSFLPISTPSSTARKPLMRSSPAFSIAAS